MLNHPDNCPSTTNLDPVMVVRNPWYEIGLLFSRFIQTKQCLFFSASCFCLLSLSCNLDYCFTVFVSRHFSLNSITAYVLASSVPIRIAFSSALTKFIAYLFCIHRTFVSRQSNTNTKPLSWFFASCIRHHHHNLYLPIMQTSFIRIADLHNSGKSSSTVKRTWVAGVLNCLSKSFQ